PFLYLHSFPTRRSSDLDFGRELDSLADVITFGIAPALLAWGWGFSQILKTGVNTDLVVTLGKAGAVAAFLFLIAGASRLARFNIDRKSTRLNSSHDQIS